MAEENPELANKDLVVTLSVDGREWELNMSTVKLSEGEKCEQLTGWTWAEWREEFFKDRARAVRFAYWMARQRAGEPFTGEFDEIEFDLADVSMDLRAKDVTPPAADKPAALGVADGVGPTGPPATAATESL